MGVRLRLHCSLWYALVMAVRVKGFSRPDMHPPKGRGPQEGWYPKPGWLPETLSVHVGAVGCHLSHETLDYV